MYLGVKKSEKVVAGLELEGTHCNCLLVRISMRTMYIKGATAVDAGGYFET